MRLVPIAAIAACLFPVACALASEAQDVLVWVPGHWEAGAHGDQRWADGYYVRGLVVDPPAALPAPQALAPALPSAAPVALQAAPPQVVHHSYDRPVWVPAISYGFSIAPGYGYGHRHGYGYGHGYGHGHSHYRSRFALSLGFNFGYPYW